jgi:hypothetical protein
MLVAVLLVCLSCLIVAPACAYVERTATVHVGDPGVTELTSAGGGYYGLSFPLTEVCTNIVTQIGPGGVTCLVKDATWQTRGFTKFQNLNMPSQFIWTQDLIQHRHGSGDWINEGYTQPHPVEVEWIQPYHWEGQQQIFGLHYGDQGSFIHCSFSVRAQATNASKYLQGRWSRVDASHEINPEFGVQITYFATQ